MIQELWQKRRCPIKSGIYFSDDSVVPFDVRQRTIPKGKLEAIRLLPPTTLNQVEEYQANHLTHLLQLCEQTEQRLKLRAYAGEAAHGSEGFVALTGLDSGQLIWLAYFDCSNPFEKVLFADHHVVAISNVGHKWLFPLDRPDFVDVETM